MKTTSDLFGTIKGGTGLVIGAGATVKENYSKIDDFIHNTGAITIGINNMTSFWTPMYHLWTNTQRFRTFGKNIKENSEILLGAGIPIKIIKDVLGNRDYILVDRVDRPGIPIDYRDGKIYGYYRTAGCLAIMILHIMGINDINVVGMDGYTMYSQTDIVSGNKDQHCYGSGFTDTSDWNGCLKKDKIIGGVLKSIRDYGVNFNIITPTKYEAFYDSTRLYA